MYSTGTLRDFRWFTICSASTTGTFVSLTTHVVTHTLWSNDMSSHPRVKSIGDQELALLRFVSDRGHATVAQAAAGFGQPHGLARSTVLTMMERLRKKGHLSRRQVDGVYQYAPRMALGVAVRHAVETFVDRTLGGSITPFVAYLAERKALSDDELAELDALLARLHRERGKKG
jgi:predicted transcriptional regulator